MTGTYVGVRFNNETNQAIARYCKQNNIPNAVPTEKLHTTVIYSRKHFEFEPLGRMKAPIVAVPDSFEIWPSDKTSKRCLVLKYRCQKLVDRHSFLMKKYDATYDYDVYKTHVTFSYDVGDMKDFPIYKGPLVIITEYTEDLDLDWKE